MLQKSGFLHFSQKADAGLVLMAELAMRAEESEDSTLGVGVGVGPLSLKEVAERTGVSFFFLQKVAVDLRKAGLICSTRGKAGGYVLGSSDISLKTILEAIDGPVAVVDCVAARHGDGCERAKLCKVRSGMNRLNQLIGNSLDGVSLEEFVRS